MVLTSFELLDPLAVLVRQRRAEQGFHLWGCDRGAGCRRPVRVTMHSCRGLFLIGFLWQLGGAPHRPASASLLRGAGTDFAAAFGSYCVGRREG